MIPPDPGSWRLPLPPAVRVGGGPLPPVVSPLPPVVRVGRSSALAFISAILRWLGTSLGPKGFGSWRLALTYIDLISLISVLLVRLHGHSHCQNGTQRWRRLRTNNPLELNTNPSSHVSPTHISYWLSEARAIASFRDQAEPFLHLRLHSRYPHPKPVLRRTASMQ